MAISATIVTMGNLTATGAYLRISDLTVKKIIESGDDQNKWLMTYGVDCYVNAAERAKDTPAKLVAPSVDRFKVIADSEFADPMAAAYANLKTRSGQLSNISDLV